MHPVHDIEVPADIATFVPTVIEIPRGSHLKYEVDKPTGLLRLDRVLYSAVHYPANYGFIPRTHADDGDPLDILVLMQEPVVPLTIVRARAIGGLRMVDDKGGDDKIIAVCIDDPAYARLPRRSSSCRRTSRASSTGSSATTRSLEDKRVDVEEFYDRDARARGDPRCARRVRPRRGSLTELAELGLRCSGAPLTRSCHADEVRMLRRVDAEVR